MVFLEEKDPVIEVEIDRIFLLVSCYYPANYDHLFKYANFILTISQTLIEKT